MEKERWLSIVYTPHKDERGIVNGIIVHASDVSEIKQTEFELRKSEDRFRTMIERAPMATALFTGQGNFIIEVASNTMLEIWGKDSSVFGQSLTSVLPALKEHPLLAIISKVYDTGEPYFGQGVPSGMEYNTLTGPKYYDVTLQPLFDRDGKVYGVIEMASNVTDQVLARHQIEDVVSQRTADLAQANRSLHESNTELQRSNKTLEEFAYAASHDLKEPIRKIKFFTDWLYDQISGQITPAQSETFARINAANDRMTSLIDNLLLYSYVSVVPVENEAVDLNDTLTDVMEDLALSVREKEAETTFSGLPVVNGYPQQLYQLFQNLINNSLKYSKENILPVVSIVASASEKDGIHYHRIDVTDNGIGFEQQYEKKIFQIFSRLHGKADYSGTGVGLSIVKKVVENHHGFIEVKSERGIGSVFSIFLPR